MTSASVVAEGRAANPEDLHPGDKTISYFLAKARMLVTPGESIDSGKRGIGTQGQSI
jgi:hypothetical protein